MVTLGSLLLPIILSTIIAFVASALVWMVLPHHRKEWKGLPNEDAVRAALGARLAPGQYAIPHAETMDAWKDPAMQKKVAEGPVGFLVLRQPGRWAMGPQLVQTFLFYMAIAAIVAYVASRTLAPGADYLAVFRVVGTVAWLAFGFGYVHDAIWFSKPWSSVIKHLADSLLYALLMAGVFAWRWPS